jgi:hypothetical protein
MKSTDLYRGWKNMPTSQNLEQPGDEKRKSDVPPPTTPKPEIKEDEKKPAAHEPGPKAPPESV